jgi:hypothetical protein
MIVLKDEVPEPSKICCPKVRPIHIPAHSNEEDMESAFIKKWLFPGFPEI